MENEKLNRLMNVLAALVAIGAVILGYIALWIWVGLEAYRRFGLDGIGGTVCLAFLATVAIVIAFTIYTEQR